MAYNHGPVPSVQALVATLRWLDKVGDPETLAMAARGIMRDAKSARDALERLDQLLGTHGVEYIAEDPGAMNPGEHFYYLNTGDTYTTTIVRHNGRWKLTSWGDLVESLERRGKSFA